MASYGAGYQSRLLHWGVIMRSDCFTQSSPIASLLAEGLPARAFPQLFLYTHLRNRLMKSLASYTVQNGHGRFHDGLGCPADRVTLVQSILLYVALRHSPQKRGALWKFRILDIPKSTIQAQGPLCQNKVLLTDACWLYYSATEAT